MQDYKNYGKPRNYELSKIKEILWMFVYIAFGIFVGGAFNMLPTKAPVKVAITINSIDCTICHNRKHQMIEYFRKAQNPTPEAMALAVLATKNPRLLAAVAVKGEKNTPYTVRKGGYKGRHAGAWQMSKGNVKAYGPVPHDPKGQALQAEKLLQDLFDELPVKQALNQYGGDSTNAYSKRVLAELVNVP